MEGGGVRNEKIEVVERLCQEVLILIAKLGDPVSGELQSEYSTSPKLRGELRRRSMDLTRSLAETRRP